MRARMWWPASSRARSRGWRIRWVCVSAVLDRRLIFVTGKGGVGKSTVAAALGLAAARQGKRTIIAEVAAQHRVARVFDHHDEGFTEAQLADGLFAISIDPQHALEE